MPRVIPDTALPIFPAGVGHYARVVSAMEQTDSVDSPRVSVLGGPPTRDHPAIILSNEGLWLVCWVENVENDTRWVAASADGVKHVGPAYGDEATLERVGDAIRRWWTMHERSRPFWASRAARPMQCRR